MARKKQPAFSGGLKKLFDTAIGCDEYDRYVFGRIKDKAPRLRDLEERGASELATFPGLFQDCFSALYKLEPALRPLEVVLPSHRPHHRLLEQVMATEEYKELRAFTTLAEFEAGMASEVVGERALQFFSEEQKEQIRDMQSEEKQSSSLEEQLEGLQTAAEAAQEAADQAQAEVKQAGNAKTASMLAAKARQLQTKANALGKQAQGVQMSLEKAKARLAQMAADQDQWFDQNLDQVRQAARQIAQQAKEEVEETSELLEAWGDEAGTLRRGDPTKAREYAERIKNSEKLRKLAKLIGRLKRLALNKAKSKAEARAQVVDVRRGRDLKNMLPSERRRLVHPLTQRQFLRNWAKAQLLVFVKRAKEKLGRGPIVVCEDGSGSMSGEKELWAKAVSLALAEVARFQKRSFAWVHFGAEHSPISVEVALGGKVTPELMFQIAETFLDASGTDFQTPLTKARENIESKEFKKADIVFITDGEAAVSDRFLADFREAKRTREFQVVAVPINIGGSSSTATLAEFADNIIPISDLSAGEAGEIFEKI